MSSSQLGSDGLKLVEENSGTGRLIWNDRVFAGVNYAINRYQGMMPSGLPVPGVHRIEGRLDLGAIEDARELVGRDLTLEYEDGRPVRITVADEDGRVLTEGHGPSRCLCC